MPTPREHVAAAAIDGIVYVIGGRGAGDARVVESYSPATDSWTTLARLTQGRSGHGVAVLRGSVYAFGGESLPFEIYRSVERYDPAENAWETIAPMPQPKTGIGVAEANGAIHVIGGSGVGSANWVLRIPE